MHLKIQCLYLFEDKVHRYSHTSLSRVGIKREDLNKMYDLRLILLKGFSLSDQFLIQEFHLPRIFDCQS